MARGFDLRGARTLLTGATGGLGQALARALRERGAELILTGRRVDVLEELAAEVDARTIAADLSARDEVQRLVAEAGDVDVLVANAGLPSSGSPLEFTPEQIERALHVNVHAPILLARSVALQMRQRERGHIVLMGSVAGITASAGTAVYNATKFAVRGFALGFRGDMRPLGIGVSVVEPGFVRDAGMFAETGTKLPRGVRTVSPAAVAAGVLRAIEKDKAEVVVAPAEIRVGAALGAVFPTLSAAVQRRSGGEGIARSLTEAQRHLR